MCTKNASKLIDRQRPKACRQCNQGVRQWDVWRVHFPDLNPIENALDLLKRRLNITAVAQNRLKPKSMAQRHPEENTFQSNARRGSETGAQSFYIYLTTKTQCIIQD